MGASLFLSHTVLTEEFVELLLCGHEDWGRGEPVRAAKDLTDGPSQSHVCDKETGVQRGDVILTYIFIYM